MPACSPPGVVDQSHHNQDKGRNQFFSCPSGGCWRCRTISLYSCRYRGRNPAKQTAQRKEVRFGLQDGQGRERRVRNSPSLRRDTESIAVLHDTLTPFFSSNFRPPRQTSAQPRPPRSHRSSEGEVLLRRSPRGRPNSPKAFEAAPHPRADWNWRLPSIDFMDPSSFRYDWRIASGTDRTIRAGGGVGCRQAPVTGNGGANRQTLPALTRRRRQTRAPACLRSR